MKDTPPAIVCLGKKFENETARREYFRQELRRKLPELKKIEGYPAGDDDVIVNMSDPPYYTACPNPWLNDFISEWEKEKKGIKERSSDFSVMEPYASDVSEGKTNSIYAAHGYHTKVPHPAIMRYILHYTQPGDIVFDGFAGSGMTAVAALACGNPDAENRYRIESEWKSLFNAAPVWGDRKAIVGDLAPVAGFIAYNYTNAFDVDAYESAIKEIMLRFEKELGWMYNTLHKNGKNGKINYTVWSEAMSCPHCNHEFNFTEEFYDHKSQHLLDEIRCGKCSAALNKDACTLLFETVFDKATNATIRRPKRIPVEINYTYNGSKYSKKPDAGDIRILREIENLPFPEGTPHFRLPAMQMTKVGRVRTTNIENIHDFFLYRPLQTLSFFWKCARETEDYRIAAFLLFTVEQMIWGMSVLNRYSPSHFSQVNRALSGVFYVASHISEVSAGYILDGKVNRLIKAFNQHKLNDKKAITYTGDCMSVNIQPDSVDYIFTDPPFGENIYYSDLNILIEAWHKVLTNARNEAIIDKAKNKTILSYQYLMEQCFRKYFEILKPGRWMTVEFSNTSAAVWNGIQTALQKAGFVVANVASLDKKQGTFQAVTSPTAVKQDLVISCYKPSDEFAAKFNTSSAGTNVWDFVREHLAHLPIHLKKGNKTTAIVERSPKILYDRLVAFYFVRGLSVPVDARDFQELLKRKFSERDGMYFTEEQAAEYDERKAGMPQFLQLSLMVASESDAIEWLKDRLRKKPQKYQDIMPDFRIATQSLRKGDTLPELKNILNENFILEPDDTWRVPDMNEMKDRETLRARVLLKEFDGYTDMINQPRAKKLKEVRVEALRAGFKNRWEKKDFATIVKVADMIPQNILLEDEQLLMYYDIARDRV